MTELYELKDVKVKTLGLVKKGASGEDFFLLKSADNGGPEEHVLHPDMPTEEGIAQRSLWQRIGWALAKTFANNNLGMVDLSGKDTSMPNLLGATAPELSQVETPLLKKDVEDTPSGALAPAVTPAESDLTEPEPEITKANELVVSDGSDVVTIQLQPGDFISVATTQDMHSITKENKTMPEVNDSPVVDLEKAELQTKVHDLEVRLQKAEAEATAERERREMEVFIAKAATYGNLPIPTGELADNLYWLSKQDPKRGAWLEAVLKAVDNQVTDAAMFGEVGDTSAAREPADEVVKAAGLGKQALLDLSPDAAKRYINETRKRIATAKGG